MCGIAVIEEELNAGFEVVFCEQPNAYDCVAEQDPGVAVCVSLVGMVDKS